jgi:DNA-binding HxlR family transcriptional regulator
VPRRTFLYRDNEQTDGRHGRGREEDSSQAAGLRRASGGQDYGGISWRRVADILSAIKGDWTLPILRHLASGTSRPTDLRDAINAKPEDRSLTAKVMYDTLKRLTEHGLVVRREVLGFPPQSHYWLSVRGHEILSEVSKLGAPDSRWPDYMLYGYEDSEPPPDVDTTIPNPARMWNHTIGGKHNWAADREANSAVLTAMPSLALSARLTRRFQADAVRLLLRRGVRQFLDIGTGLPADEAVHEVAQREHPESRVVYVDNDPAVMAHARALLRSAPEGRCAFVHADLRQPEEILARAWATLDPTQPVAVFLLMVLHFIRDEEDPRGIVRRLLDGIDGTSYLVVAHAASDTDPQAARAAASRYNDKSPARVRLRSHAEVEGLFAGAGAELLPPGLVTLSDWWPEGTQDGSVPPGVNGHIGIGWRPSR